MRLCRNGSVASSPAALSMAKVIARSEPGCGMAASARRCAECCVSFATTPCWHPVGSSSRADRATTTASSPQMPSTPWGGTDRTTTWTAEGQVMVFTTVAYRRAPLRTLLQSAGLVHEGGTASPLVSDALWSIIEPLLPVVPQRPRGGRPRVPNRAALTRTLFVLRTGIQLEMLPLEMGYGSGVTCWRRLRDWQEAVVWNGLHRELLRRLRAADRIDWSRACMDSASLAAKRGLTRQGRTRPTEGGSARSAT